MAAWNDKYPYKYWSDELKEYIYIETDEEYLKKYGKEALDSKPKI